MNWLDIVLIILIIGSAISGLAGGLIKTVMGLVGMIVGVVLAGHFYVFVAGWMTFLPDNFALILSFALIVIVVLVIATIIGNLLTKAVSAVLLGWVNRLAGFVVGGILGAIWSGVLLAVWVKYLGPGSGITDSVIAPILLERLPFVLALLPDEFDVIRQFFQ